MYVLQVTTNLLTRAVAIVFGCLTLIAATNSFAERSPVTSRAQRETTKQLDTYNHAIEFVRERTSGKKSASFHAEPYLLDSKVSALITISSVSKVGKIERFRCIATHDLAECLGSAVKIRYLPKDQRLVLSVQFARKVDDAGKMAVASRQTIGSPNTL